MCKHVMAVLFDCTCGYNGFIRADIVLKEGEAHDKDISYDGPNEGSDTLTIEYICICGYHNIEEHKCNEHKESMQVSMFH